MRTFTHLCNWVFWCHGRRQERKELLKVRCILVAEDQEAEIQLLRIAWANTGTSIPIHFVTSGKEAIDYLSGQGAFADRKLHPLPTLLLLDLKMPVVSG